MKLFGTWGLRFDTEEFFWDVGLSQVSSFGFLLSLW